MSKDRKGIYAKRRGNRVHIYEDGGTPMFTGNVKTRAWYGATKCYALWLMYLQGYNAGQNIKHLNKKFGTCQECRRILPKKDLNEIGQGEDGHFNLLCDKCLKKRY